MKKIPLPLLLVMTLIAFAMPLRAEESSNPRLLTVTGEGEVKVAPDEVTLNFGVQTFNPILATAKEENSQKIQKVLSVTKKYNLEDKYVQTTRINIQPRYKNGWETGALEGYNVSNNIAILLKDVLNLRFC